MKVQKPNRVCDRCGENYFVGQDYLKNVGEEKNCPECNKIILKKEHENHKQDMVYDNIARAYNDSYFRR